VTLGTTTGTLILQFVFLPCFRLFKTSLMRFNLLSAYFHLFKTSLLAFYYFFFASFRLFKTSLLAFCWPFYARLSISAQNLNTSFSSWWKTCQSYGVTQIWCQGCFRSIKTLCKSKVIWHLSYPNLIGELTLRAYLNIDDSIITCLFGVICRFQYMSILILRSYGIELLIRQNAINPALYGIQYLLCELWRQHH